MRRSHATTSVSASGWTSGFLQQIVNFVARVPADPGHLRPQGLFGMLASPLEARFEFLKQSVQDWEAKRAGSSGQLVRIGDHCFWLEQCRILPQPCLECRRKSHELLQK